MITKPTSNRLRNYFIRRLKILCLTPTQARSQSPPPPQSRKGGIFSLSSYKKLTLLESITLDPRVTFPGIFPGPATTKKVYQGIEWFSQLVGLQWLTVLSMLIRGITITLTGDWHSGQLAALFPCIMLRKSSEGKIQHISVLWMWWLIKIIFSALRHNCNVMEQHV